MNRPTSVTVVAVLNIIIGSLQVLCGPLALASLFLMSRMMEGFGGGGPEAEAMVEMMQSPALRIVTISTVSVNILIGIGLLINGISLLAMSAKARVSAMVLAVLLGLWQVIGQIANWLITYPMLRQLDTVRTNSQMMTSVFSGVFWTVIYLAYVVAVVVIMTRPAVKDSFTKRPVEFGH